MKIIKCYFLMVLMAMIAVGTKAQTANKLIVPDITVQIGQAELPINIENTDELVAIQFDIMLPNGFEVQEEGRLSNRSDGHEVTVRYMEGVNGAFYRVLVYSPANKAFLGQSGPLLYLPITIPNNVIEGEEYQPQVSNIVLSKPSGENVVTETTVGKLKIAKMPDLTVTNISAEKSTLTPGENVVVSWQVENIGGLSTSGGWSEQVSLVSEDGSMSKLIATTHYEEILDVSGIVSRQAEVTLPFLLGVDGQVKLQVRIVPDSDTGESASAQANNIQTSDNILTVNKLLNLKPSPKRIDENSTRRIALCVNRSGRWTVAETFAITVTEDSRLSVPSSITIPANQSGAVVYFNVTDNEVLDNDSIVSISVEGNGYPIATSPLIIDDNELPTLTVTSSKAEVSEGETFQLTITTSRTSSTPITMTLTSENARRFTFPKQVVIPAGETSVTVDIVAVDNDEIELQESTAFRASADKHERGECIILVNDNDMPTLTFTLSPEAVSESDGYAALFGVIKRTDNLDKRVTLKLSDDSNGLLTYSNQTIVMAKNQAEVRFNIGVTDNDLVDGNHVVNVTAAVYASSCNCSVSEDNKGSMKATVTIIDDDGPTLKIKPAGTAMLEGSENNVFTISHNVRSDADVTVHISSDKDDMLEYDHELTIPAGQSSANLLVNVKSNDQKDDSSIAAFKAEANGYSLGTCWILITDQTLPDAIVSLYADKTEVEAEQTVLLRAVVKNVGNASLRSTTPVEISFSGKTDNVKLTVGKNVAVGDSAVIEYNYDIPAITGNHTFEATVNASGKVPELIYANNTSPKVGISVISPFSVTAQANRDIYLQDDSIHVTGTATGSAGKNANIEVYFINEGARQTVSVTSDDEGNYTAGWKPLSKQSGHFIVGACYPNSKATEEMDAFDVYGIRTKENYKTCELSHTEKITGKIILSNPGNLAQSGLTITPKSDSENCEFTFNAPNAIGAGESVEIAYTVKANEITEGRDWQQMPIEITTAEGSHANYSIYYYVHSLKARLQANKTSINTTMTLGTPREYPVTIRNVGKAETGKITLALPNWIQAVTPSEMTSLAQGDSATILLRFIPTEAMKLNVRVSGQIGINCANGDGTAISFNLTPVSDEKGKLKVDVVDEYTFFTNEAPHVSKAKVRVKNPSTNEVVAEGETADDGTFSAELPEGYYSVTVDADKHDSYANTVIVDPGVEKEEEVFLSYQAITYSWDVEETGVEDEYEIETIVKYETRVPKPVVIITLPDEQPEPYSIIPVILTNKGLVNAVDVNLSLSISNGYTLEFLNDPSLEVLAPQQSHVFYAKMVPETGGEAPARAQRASSNSSRCFTLIARAKYKELCQKYTGEELAEQIKKWGTRHCLSSGSGGGGGGSYGGGGGYGPGHGPGYWGNGSYGSGYVIWDTDDPAKFCDKVLNDDGEEEPEESPCDEKPILNYKLVSTDSNHYDMKGVAADGVSQVKIVLEKGSSIPSADCNYTCHWELSEDIGTLENEDSWNNVIYTAPEDYPSNKGGHSFKIQAKLSYTNGEIKGDTIIDIEVARVPLVLLHGLNSNEECWRSFADKLITEGLYEANQIDRSGYEATNCRYFTINMGKPQKKIENLIHSYKYNYQIVASKADLVGHSMGGILSRLHVQYVKNDNVHKVITVNTPHSGSELGDIVDALPFIVKETICKFKLGGFSSTEAISDLAVDSYAIDNFLNNQVAINKMVGIPVHAVVTEASKIQDLENVEVVDLKSLFEYGTGKAARVLNMSKNGWLFILQLVRGLGYDDINEVGASDYVVSVQSQKGGLPESNISFVHGPWHCGSPDDSSVQSSILSALTASVKSNMFSQSGFRPVDRKFAFKSKQIARSREHVVEAAGKSVSMETNIENDSLYIIVHGMENITKKMIFVRFSNDDFCLSDRENLNCVIPSTHKGNITAYAIWRDSNGEFQTDSTTIYIERTRANLLLISSDNLYASINDSLDVKIKCLWSDGSISYVKPENINSTKDLFTVNGSTIIPRKIGEDNVTFSYNGLSCTALLTVYGNEFADSDDDEDSDDSPSICSTVTLSFKQKNVMTRQAFRGTLTVNNGNETTAMKNVKMNLEVHDMDGNLTTSHEFQIDAESLNGFEGNLDFTSGWTLGGGETGVATILFIPTKYAAPTEPKDYSFGGSFSYTDPYTGLTVTRDLNPVTLTVNPSPNLEMTYFMQRDVFGDDPLTETVEPMIPSEFALIVNNKGYGDAENMNLTTHQPEIIDNQKGLAISFELISTQLNGGDKNLSLGGSMTSDFGTIPAHSQAYAQWWLQSSLLGHFIEYNVKATHLTSRNNPDLSLLDTVTVHELIHGFTVRTDGDKPLRGFLVNDIKDREDLPDEVYFTDATQQGTYIATSANIVKQSDTEFVLNITVGSPGWNYGSLLDPTYGKQKLVNVTRADGTEVNVDNIWQTSCTLRDGKDPLYEKRLHFVGNMSADGETFYLTFEPKPELELEVESYAGVPEEGTVLKEQLTELRVKFNKAIKAESFTTEDITVNCQGVAQDDSQIVIEQVNESEFKLKFNEVTLLDGYYVLNVQTSGIEDSEGFTGSTGKQASWIQFVDGKVVLKVAASPSEGGTVTPASGRFDYDSDVTLKAVAAEGYEFTCWKNDNSTVGNMPEYNCHLSGNTELTAIFTPKHYEVTIECDEEQGSVTNAASGIYDFGTSLQMTAVSQPDFVFTGWVINGEVVAEGSRTLIVTVDKALHIRAEFVREVYHQDITIKYGWNWMSTYMGEPVDINEVIPYANRIVGQFDELILDPQYGMVGGLDSFQPGKAYKIEAKTPFTKSFSGHIYQTETMPIGLRKGWNWIAYPYMESASVSSVIANASEGDYIATQTGFAEYADGYWEGTLNMFEPGMGYLYMSTSDKNLVFDFTSVGAHESRAKRSSTTAVTHEEVDVHRYPNTMNLTAKLYKDGTELTSGDYLICAMANNELRGVSQYIGNNYYITVYGDEPVDITFICESTETGSSFVANETLQFRDDVIGSRKSPFVISFGDVTGIEQWDCDQKHFTVYSLEGILIGRDMTLKMLQKLPKGLYIVNGQKRYVK